MTVYIRSTLRPVSFPILSLTTIAVCLVLLSSSSTPFIPPSLPSSQLGPGAHHTLSALTAKQPLSFWLRTPSRIPRTLALPSPPHSDWLRCPI
ncbi:hypothetical protein K437DRAFT_76544 [Tilletiaria anomala UBC 951]|uniref:Uncharacterized protein n=1 Tax=Tilletiaria anomala (strain ATCC 24038 / CBS 436.72 / UBC 951) TaxID=1037660 RepID=A0A066WFP5_TILAU|nr:uncharacterized protein K437DRAFT_76544 [Tilletiaria anomala UBC 951]KDN49575.1 hypothetical protein K437DRAFT_76544 [Tilletiaria anomala UBC 951]